MFLFDTDHFVILQQQPTADFDHLIQRVRERDPSDLFVSVISFHEQVMGWNAYISKARKSADVVRGYERLVKVLTNFSEAQVLPFDEGAANCFDELKKRRIRIGTMDLRIAAIALSRRLTVLSRNLRDFKRVPDLPVEDWTNS